MKPYQQEYLELVRDAAQQIRPSADELEPEAFVEASKLQKRRSFKAIERGTELLREQLFPALGNIFAVSDEDARDLEEFAAELTRPGVGNDVELSCRIHQALLSRARKLGDRDGIIRELYLVGMSLHNLESMLSPNNLRLYTTRMRMCFTESASYYETAYDDISDPETRGYIHRSMGNIALSYVDNSPASAKAKLAAITRSLKILSDPEVQAKTPSLPWDVYIYKTHQECTTLLSFLRSGQAGPEAFAQVLESAQIVQDRQLAAATERGEPPQPRWQYAYIAARYHCGAMLLPDLLDGLYWLSSSMPDDDMGHQSMFSHVTAPALYLEYSRGVAGGPRAGDVEQRVPRMIKRLFSWLVRLPSGADEQVMFAVRQFIYFYRELPGCMSFYEALQNVLAACCPNLYARTWIVSRLAERLARWAVSDCPERLAGIPGFASREDVAARPEEFIRTVRRAGRVFDAGMIHFVNFEASACRGLISDEEALLQLHAHCGAMLLSRHPSTAVFADAAKGHHCNFDGRGGYPMDFSIMDSPMRPLIAILSAADALAAAVEEVSTRMRPYVTFDQALSQLEEGSGTVYAPFVVKLLTPQRREELRRGLESWRHEAYLHMYNRRAAMRSEDRVS